MLPIHTILHATDFSPHSEPAFQLAQGLARDYQARLILLHVAAPPSIVYGAGVVPSEPDVVEAEQKRQLRKMADSCQGLAVTSLLQQGDPAREILRVAEQTKCDLIVLGTHGRSGIQRLLLGSVAEEVLRKAPCLVLTVKTPLALVPLTENAVLSAIHP